MELSRSKVLVLVVLLLLAAGAFGWWNFSHPSLDRYSAALEAIRTHHIRLDNQGRVDLSKQFPGLVPEDLAQATWLDDGNFRAMFPTYRGQSSQVAGLMYTSRPLTEDDTQARPVPMHQDQRTIEVGTYGYLILDGKINDHWYRVSFRLH